MLELREIVKKYGDRTIIDHLNLEVKDGEILTIVGESGGGKTTLLRCISGLEKINSGQILIDGQNFDPYQASDDSVIGVVFQDYNLFPHMTVLENIALAPIMVLKKNKTIAHQEAQKLLERLSLGDKGQLYPYQLSGGQKQRVAIARALAMKPKILCYDEPTSALDPNLTKAVEEIILDLKKSGMTQIIITHDWDFAERVSDETLTVKPLKFAD